MNVVLFYTISVIGSILGISTTGYELSSSGATCDKLGLRDTTKSRTELANDEQITTIMKHTLKEVCICNTPM